MRRLVLVILTTLASLALSAVPAFAGAPVAGTPASDGLFPHTHHVDTGNGGCVDIDAVAFFAVTDPSAGLHMGANASGPDLGPWHGTC